MLRRGTSSSKMTTVSHSSLSPSSQHHHHEEEEERLPLNAPPSGAGAVAAIGDQLEDETSSSNCNTQQQQQQQQRLQEFREENGLCLTCGQQLYKIKKKKKTAAAAGATRGFLQKHLSFRSLRKGSSSRDLLESPPLRKSSTTATVTAKSVKKKPLTIEGQVKRGQCLNCCSSNSNSNSTNKDCKATVVSSSEDDEDSSRSLAEPSQLQPQRRAPPTRSGSGGRDQAVYRGSFNAYGERDGTGTMTWENGDVYEGDFFNGNRHGRGALRFADGGGEYVGEWECNQQHGVGTRIWKNGDCYTGQYRRGQRTGEGRFYFANGDLYIGAWQRGAPHGPGRYYYASGQRFEGQFVRGRRRGKGKLQRTDGSLEVGVYENDRRCGVGVRWSADRTRAWRLQDGKVQKRVSIPEAVSLDYEMDADAQRVLCATAQTGVV